LAYYLGEVIVETGAFTARIRTFLEEEEYRRLQTVLAGHPDAGAIIPGTGGLRKLRWAGSGRGKRGGIRVIYFWHRSTARILLLLAYAKNERDDLSETQKRNLRRIIESEYP
jgi:hypothetical protein